MKKTIVAFLLLACAFAIPSWASAAPIRAYVTEFTTTPPESGGLKATLQTLLASRMASEGAITPVAAPSDPLSFAGSAFCTDPSTMAFESTWQDDGSVALLARRADKADGIELRVGSTSWTPSSADGPWALFTLPAGSVSRDATVELVALGADGSAVATEEVEWRTGPASGTRKPVAGAP